MQVVLTVERYVAVTKPFHTRISSPRRRAKLISATLSLTAVLYNIPLIFELLITGTTFENNIDFSDSSAHEVTASKKDVIYFWTVETAPFRSNFYYQTIYRVVGNLLFISLVPFVIISTLTMKIVFVVRRTNRERAYYRRALGGPSSGTTTAAATSTVTSSPSTCSVKLPGGGPHSHSATAAANAASSTAAATYGNVLLTVFVIKFLICYTLPFALNVLELLLPSNAFRTAELMWVTDVSDFLVILDSVSNAFLYFSWRRRIRFYKKRRTTPSLYSKDPSAVHEYLRSTCGSPCPSLSRTSSRRVDVGAQQQLLKSFPPPPAVRYYRDLAVANGHEDSSMTQPIVSLRVPLGKIWKAARV